MINLLLILVGFTVGGVGLAIWIAFDLPLLGVPLGILGGFVATKGLIGNHRDHTRR